METLIRNLLLKSVKPDMVDKILHTSLDNFQAAFTSKEYDASENYEFFEQLGDLSINKFIVSYMGKRFPQLRSSNGVGVLASLRILYGSKDVLSTLSEKYQMDKFIRCTKDEMLDKNKFRNILEDVFEAFFGALEFSIDKLWFNGLGYISVYNILEKMFDDIKIEIDYESLVDAKTRLNELKDEKKLSLKYIDVKMDNGMFRTDLFVDSKFAGQGISNVKKNSQIIAAEQALKWIEINLGIKKDVPERFRIISNKIW